MKAYAKNPRMISDKQREELKSFLRELGDLGGVVHDLNSDQIIGGNQRSQVFDINKCEIVLEHKMKRPDSQGTVALGYVIWKGKRYSYRQVRWTPKQCEKANIVANKAGGDWDEELLKEFFKGKDLINWGFDDGEIEDLFGEEKKKKVDAAPRFDEADKKRRTPRHPAVPPEVSSARKYAAYQMRIMNPRMTFAAITQELNELFPEYPLKSEHQAVEKMIKEAEKEYIETHKSKVDEIKAEAGAALDWVRHEAAEAWKRSQDLLKIIKKKEGQTVEQILKAEFGNAQFLRRVTEAVEVKTKIFGALAPKRHEVTGKDGAPLVPSFDLKTLSKFITDDELVKIYEAAEILERAQQHHDREAAAKDTD